MSILPWSSLMSVGNPLIDQQHRTLLRIVNDVYAGVIFGRSMDIFSDEFPVLMDYVTKHFMVEEMLMEASGYPDYQNHKQQHNQLREKLESIGKKLEQDKDSLDYVKVCNFLSNWLTAHVMAEDQEYKDSIALVGEDVYDRIEEKLAQMQS